MRASRISARVPAREELEVECRGHNSYLLVKLILPLLHFLRLLVDRTVIQTLAVVDALMSCMARQTLLTLVRSGCDS